MFDFKSRDLIGWRVQGYDGQGPHAALSHESLRRGVQRAAKKGTLPGDASCSAG